MKDKFWQGHVADRDDFGNPIKNVFVDGKTKVGQWAIMSPSSWRIHGVGRLGLGYGQRYCKTNDGQWIKTEG
jgi:hypothetical protein